MCKGSGQASSNAQHSQLLTMSHCVQIILKSGQNKPQQKGQSLQKFLQPPLSSQKKSPSPKRSAMAVAMIYIRIGLKIVQHGVRHAENATSPIIGKLYVDRSQENPVKEDKVNAPW